MNSEQELLNWLRYGEDQARGNLEKNADSEEVAALTGYLEAWEDCAEYVFVMQYSTSENSAAIVNGLHQTVQVEIDDTKRKIANRLVAGGLTDYQRGVLRGYQEIKHKLETML